MAIRAVVFDIGGVLEITPDLGVTGEWEARLGLSAGSWTGACTTRGGEAASARSPWTRCTSPSGTASAWTMSSSRRSWPICGASTWAPRSTELIDYLRRLRPRYRTGILSNSFVGAREREQEAYGFGDLVDHIVYSHEAGMSKPDPRAAGLHAVCYQDNAQAIAAVEALLGTPSPR